MRLAVGPERPPPVGVRGDGAVHDLLVGEGSGLAQLLGRVVVTGAFDDDVRVVPFSERLCEAPVGADELHSFPVEVVRRLEGRRPPPQRVQQRERVLDRGEREQPDGADRQQRREPQAGARDDPERALAADEQPGEVIAGVVLQQPAQPPHRRPVGEHRLQAGDPGTRHAVPGRKRAAGVRRDHAADRRRAASGEVDGEVETLPADVILQRSSVTPAPHSTCCASMSTGRGRRGARG